MKRLQAFKYELMPNGEQQRQMRRFAGACRFVYNKALALQQERHTAGEKKLGYASLCKSLTEWKTQAEMLWLSETPSQALQQALKDLERAYQNFFEKRADFPRFKKKGTGDSFRYPQGCKLDQANGRIFLPKLGWVRYRNSRDVLGDICNVTISQSGGKWFASIQTRREVPAEQPTGGIVGLDMGIARFVTLSDGSHLDPLNSFKKHQQRLKRYQRRMARKVKFSQNWQLEKGESQSHTDSHRHRQCPQGLSAPSFTCHQPKPRDSVHRRFAGSEYVQVQQRQCRNPRQAGETKVRPESGDSRSGMGRVPAAARLQAGVARWASHRRAASVHQPDLPLLRPRFQGQSPDASEV